MKKAHLASLASAVLSISALTLASRIVGFARVWVQNGALGDTLAGSAYSTSNTVPNVLFEVAAGGALAGAVIPLISGFLATKMKTELDHTASALLTWVTAVGCCVSLIVVAYSHQLALLLIGHGAPSSEIDLAASLVSMFALQIPLYGSSVVFTGVLQAHGHFMMPALAPILSSFISIGVFAVFKVLAQGFQNDPAQLSTTSVAVLGWGTTIGVAVFALSQAVPASHDVRFRLRFRFPSGVGRRAVKLVGAGLGGILAQQVQIVTIMVVTNRYGGIGTYPIYTFAAAVYMVPYAVLAVPISTAVFPRLASAVALREHQALADLTARSTRLVAHVGVIAAGVLVSTAIPVADIFGVLRPVPGLEHALMTMALGVAGYGLIYHCSRVLYAWEASGSVLLLNSFAWLTVCGVLIAQVALGVSGRIDVLSALGIATSVGMCLGAWAQIVVIRHLLGKQATHGILRSLCVMACGVSVITFGAFRLSRALRAMWGHGFLASIGTAGVSGLLVVACGFVLMRISDPHALALIVPSMDRCAPHTDRAENAS
ncbi:MAG: lipid II flippase MurJ [Actinomycetaceae bacterium]|nr:lipid II flippase MurJ [Actinomycetaceae bacterium]MDY6083243.1 lipid II flippase MurJ [Actinomycetaceae bacterium]